MDRCTEKASGWECVGRGNKGNLLFTFFRRGPKEIFGVGRYRSNPRRVTIRFVTHETIVTSHRKQFGCPEISRNFQSFPEVTGLPLREKVEEINMGNLQARGRDLPRATRPQSSTKVHANALDSK